MYTPPSCWDYQDCVDTIYSQYSGLERDKGINFFNHIANEILQSPTKPISHYQHTLLTKFNQHSEFIKLLLFSGFKESNDSQRLIFDNTKIHLLKQSYQALNDKIAQIDSIDDIDNDNNTVPRCRSEILSFTRNRPEIASNEDEKEEEKDHDQTTPEMATNEDTQCITNKSIVSSESTLRADANSFTPTATMSTPTISNNNNNNINNNNNNHNLLIPLQTIVEQDTIPKTPICSEHDKIYGAIDEALEEVLSDAFKDLKQKRDLKFTVIDLILWKRRHGITISDFIKRVGDTLILGNKKKFGYKLIKLTHSMFTSNLLWDYVAKRINPPNSATLNNAASNQEQQDIIDSLKKKVNKLENVNCNLNKTNQSQLQRIGSLSSINNFYFMQCRNPNQYQSPIIPHPIHDQQTIIPIYTATTNMQQLPNNMDVSKVNTKMVLNHPDNMGNISISSSSEMRAEAKTLSNNNEINILPKQYQGDLAMIASVPDDNNSIGSDAKLACKNNKKQQQQQNVSMPIPTSSDTVNTSLSSLQLNPKHHGGNKSPFSSKPKTSTSSSTHQHHNNLHRNEMNIELISNDTSAVSLVNGEAENHDINTNNDNISPSIFMNIAPTSVCSNNGNKGNKKRRRRGKKRNKNKRNNNNNMNDRNIQNDAVSAISSVPKQAVKSNNNNSNNIPTKTIKKGDYNSIFKDNDDSHLKHVAPACLPPNNVKIVDKPTIVMHQQHPVNNVNAADTNNDTKTGVPVPSNRNTETVHKSLVIRKKMDNTDKKLLIVRGLSGSGRTVLAQKWLKTIPNAVICNDDKYWSGKYEFTPYSSGARKFCKDLFERLVKGNNEFIILEIDYPKVLMYEHLIKYAIQNGWKQIRIIEIVGINSLIDIYKSRSTRNMPTNVYVEILKIWQRDPRAELIYGYKSDLESDQCIINGTTAI